MSNFIGYRGGYRITEQNGTYYAWYNDGIPAILDAWSLKRLVKKIDKAVVRNRAYKQKISNDVKELRRLNEES